METKILNIGNNRSLIVYSCGKIECEYIDRGSVKRYTPVQVGNNKGYLRIHVKEQDKQRHMAVHRLIASCFIPNPQNLPQVNHINGNKQDNRASNLEWVTSNGNIIHAINHGKIQAFPVVRISRKSGERVNYRSIREAERDNNTGTDTIRNYCLGKRKQPNDYVWELEKPADIEAARKERND